LLALSAAALAVPALPSAALAYGAQQQQSYHGPAWRGQDGRLYCKRSNGTTGLIVGGAAGVLAGRTVDTRGERTTGTILGGALGALLGRHAERNMIRRCR
jgi:outer membrane lipoprotein SlyB